MSDYSLIDRYLHRVALSSPVLSEMLHDIEKTMFLKRAPAFEPQQHVFVTGLARAGTTVLMRELHSSGQFASLTYADMPFVLAPNLWARLSRAGRAADAMKERAHGDGILVNSQSPEALDEVYWRLLSGIDYIRDDGLHCHSPDEDAIDGFGEFIRLVLLRGGKSRYLSKNNNMLLRLGALADAWPDTVFLVPFRDPLQHAASLLGQHERFADADPFTRSYMAWLGHHEFGATHRPYRFGPVAPHDPASLDYWLTVWIGAYRHVLDTAQGRANVLLVCHEDLTTRPSAWARVLGAVGLEQTEPGELRKVDPRPVPPHEAALAAEARALYETLRQAADTQVPEAVGG